MSFTADFSQATEFTPVKDGNYEVIVKAAYEDATKGGAEYINIDLVVRNDIEQEFKNCHIFHKLWKKKADGKYNFGMMMALAKNLRMQDGKKYNNLQEFLDDFVGKVCKVRVANEKSTSADGSKTYENLNVKQITFSAYPSIQHKWKADDQPETPVNVEDYDLPF